MGKHIDWSGWIGKKFGRLTVIGTVTEPSGRKRVRLHVTCECGSQRFYRPYVLTNEKVRRVSCGCYKRELIQRLGRAMKTHGATGTPTHVSWTAMLWRTNPKNKQDYHYYKDITVCERWKGRSGFHNFLADMGERKPGTTLDRIDNSKGYYKENCRWADHSTQVRNRRPSTRKAQIKPKCRNGHQLTPENLDRRNGKFRRCTICRKLANNASNRRRRERLRIANAAFKACCKEAQ